MRCGALIAARIVRSRLYRVESAADIRPAHCRSQSCTGVTNHHSLPWNPGAARAKVAPARRLAGHHDHRCPTVPVPLRCSLAGCPSRCARASPRLGPSAGDRLGALRPRALTPRQVHARLTGRVIASEWPSLRRWCRQIRKHVLFPRRPCMPAFMARQLLQSAPAARKRGHGEPWLRPLSPPLFLLR